ncbi:MAG TPA: hypothetical protein VND89_01575, partial [Acidimicrobiales bacterium]|nr:hypothetical protein [Acidimicrobiales bacterium]
WYVVALAAFCLLMALSNHLPGHVRGADTPYWLWQIVLVPSSLLLVAAPWWQAIQRQRGRPETLHFRLTKSYTSQSIRDPDAL